MALVHGNDYHSTVLWFLDDSPAGNSPEALDLARRTRLEGLLWDFNAQYVGALATMGIEDARRTEAANSMRSVVDLARGSLSDLISAIDTLNRLLQMTEARVFSVQLVASALKKLLLEFFDIAEGFGDKTLDKSVVAASKTFTTKYKEAQPAAG